MKPLDPLAVGHIAFASGHVLDVPGIDEEHREASCLQHFIERDPIHAGRLHRDGVDVTGREPVGQVDERMREAPELPHRLLVSVCGDRHPMTPGPNVDTRGIEMHLLQELLLPGPSLRAPLGARGVLGAWHRSLLYCDERGASEGRNASGSTLLNRITPCASPMMFSRHSRAMLSNGGSPTSVPSASALGCFTQATSTAARAGQFRRDVSRRKGAWVGCQLDQPSALPRRAM